MSLVEISKPPIVDRLRQVADVLDRIGIEPAYVSIRCDETIGVDESTFRKMFRGESFTGQRNGSSAFIEVRCCRHGIVWAASLYSPLPEQNTTASITA
jgi:hypothetical protein